MPEYHRQRASDGGLQITEAAAVSSAARAYHTGPGLYIEEHVTAWKAITDAVHEKGGVIFIQLSHAGRATSDAITGAHPVAPSVVPRFCFPNLHEPFDPAKPAGRLRRFKINLANRRAKTHEVEALYPEVTGVLARQDDRFHTLPYRYGFMNADGARCRWAMFDHQQRTSKIFSPRPDLGVSEMCFARRKKRTPEGNGI